MGVLNCFRRKAITDLINESNNNQALERTFGPFQLIMLGIGAIIGAGVFVLLGAAAAQHAGPSTMLSFVLAGLACMCAALCYAELAASIPVSGSSYSFIYASLGELPSFIIVGMILLTYCLGSASVAGGWSGYLQSFLHDYGMHVPVMLSKSFGHVVQLADGSTVTTLFDLPALIIVCLIFMVVVVGAEASALVNTIIVVVKMTVLSAFVIVGSTKIDPANWTPFIPENTGEFGKFGWSGILSGASVILLAYSGFDAVSTAAQETKNPKKDLPIGIVVSLSVCALFYIAVCAVLTGLVPYQELNVPEPMAVAVNKMHMPIFAVFTKIGAIVGLTSVILVLMYGSVRILYAVTNDGLLPSFLAKIHPKFRTPHILTILVWFVIALFGSIVPTDKLVKIANFGILVNFATVCLATVYLRYSQPELKRDFKCPMMPFIPLAGAFLFLCILCSLPMDIMLSALAWIVVLLIVYFGYSIKHSKLNNK